MALLEMALLACDTLAIVGKLIFLSLFAAFATAWQAIKLGTVFALACFDYLHIGFYMLGLFLYNAVELTFPYLWDSAMLTLHFLQTAWGYFIASCVDCGLFIWNNPSFVNLRENLCGGVVDGAVTMATVVWEDPLYATQCFLMFVWPILFLAYRKDLLVLFRRIKRDTVGRMAWIRDLIVYFAWDVAYWTMAPVRFVRGLPAKTKASVLSLWMSITAWTRILRIERGPVSVGNRAGPAAISPKMLRGPSFFQRLKKTESASHLERLENETRVLRTQLAEERESKLCIICQSGTRAVVLMPCKHFALCEDCLALLPVNILSRKVCPVCRTQVDKTIRVYL